MESFDTRWLIIADDLTGAADCGVAFAKRRLPARVLWADVADPVVHPPVALAIDAGSRGLDANSAGTRHRDLLQRYLLPGMRAFKKIDSTLRGNPGAEIAAMFDVFTQSPGARLIVAPAFPAGGRVTRNAHVYVHGVPLEFSEFWTGGADASGANVVHLLEAAGIPAAPVPLQTIRAGDVALRAAFARIQGSRPAAVVCDAETDFDLDCVVAASLGPQPTLLVGSAGLAHALALRISRDVERRVDPVRVPLTQHGALIVVGSQAQASRAALRGLASLTGIEHANLAADRLGEPESNYPLGQWAGDLIARLEEGLDVVVDLAAPDAEHSLAPGLAGRLARQFAQRVAPLAAHASALVATGGETASALFARCGITGIQLVDEIEHGIALGLTLGSLAVPVVTKAGGFGDAGSLRRIVERLRFIRGSGTVA